MWYGGSDQTSKYQVHGSLSWSDRGAHLLQNSSEYAGNHGMSLPDSGNHIMLSALLPASHGIRQIQ